MNTISITGRLISDAEIKYSNSGKEYATMCISVYKGKDNDGKSKTFLLNVTAINFEGARMLTKGTTITVTGRLEISDGKNGQKYTDVVAYGFDSIGIVPRRISEGGSNAADDIPF